MNVVIVRKVPERSKRLILSKFPRDWKVVMVSSEELNKELEDVETIIPEHHIIDGPFLDRAKHLKLVQTGAGYDNVVVDECTKRGVYVANAAGINAPAVAEHVFAFILSWYKNIISLDGVMKKGEYDVEYIGAELSGKVIGIVGLGYIGREVTHLAKAFNMNVLGYHVRSIDTEVEFGFTDFETLLKSSDIVTLHIPLNDRTRYLIGQRKLDLMVENIKRVSEGKGKINVYYLKNADAEEMAEVLTEITSKARPTKEPKKGIEFAGEVIITPDKSTNSLVITASPQDYKVLRGVIKKPDIRRLPTG